MPGNGSSRIQSILLSLLVLLCLAPLGAEAVQVSHITQHLALHNSIVATDATSWATVAGLQRGDEAFLFGYRNVPPLTDATVCWSHTLKGEKQWTSKQLLSTLHGSFGVAEATLLDLVLAYSRRFFLPTSILDWELSYSIGVQESMSIFPFIDKPLYNTSPHLGLKISCTALGAATLSAQISTNTLFTYVCQAWGPIVGVNLSWKICDALQIGTSYEVQFSDVYPESVILLRKEAGIYATWNP